MSRLSLALFGVLLALLLYALWNVPYVATHDGPNHLANCVLANRLEDPASPLHAYLEYGAPVTTQGFQVVCERFEAVFGWRIAYAVSLTVVALLWALGYAALARALRSPFAHAGFISALGWAFSMGFVTWSMSLGIAFFVLAYLISRPAMTLRSWAVLSVLILLTAYSHTFVAAMLGAAVVSIAWFRAGAERGDRSRALLGAAIAGIPAVILTVLSSTATEVGATTWPTFAQRITRVMENYVGGPSYRGLPPVLFALAAIALAMFGLIQGRVTGARRGIFVFVLACLAAYAILPYDYSNWAFLGPRPLIAGLALAPLAVPPEYFERARARIAAELVTFAIAAVSLGWFAKHNLDVQPVIEEALSGLQAPIHRTGARQPLIMVTDAEKEIDAAEPLLMIGHLYLFDQGGIDPYVWADDPTKDALRFLRPPDELFGPHAPRFLVNDLGCAGKKPNCPPLPLQYELHALRSTGFEDVILYADDPRAIATFTRRGYAIDFQQGRLAILRPRRCSGALHVERDPAEQASLRVQLIHPELGVVVEERALEAAARSTVAFDGTWCGRSHVRVIAEDGTPRACREAGAEPVIAVELSPEHAFEATCTMGQR